MTFPKDYHITERDETVSHAAARNLHDQQRLLTQQRKKRKLPKNMDPLKKAIAIAGSDLIMSAGHSKNAFLIAYFGASYTDDGSVGFGLGVDMATIDGHHRASTHYTVAAVSGHAAARVIGRTVHSADRAALREAIRPAFTVLAHMWLKNQEGFKSMIGKEVAVISPRGALLGNMKGGTEPQVHLATWVDAHGAYGREIPDLCHSCTTRGFTAIIATREDGRWREIT